MEYDIPSTLPSTTNILSDDVRAAMRRSDNKAGRLLGVIVTREVYGYPNEDTSVSASTELTAQGLSSTLPPTTNILSHEVRAAMRRSDNKASRLLGATVTRDVYAYPDENTSISASTVRRNSKKRSFSMYMPSLAGAFRNVTLGRATRGLSKLSLKDQPLNRIVLGSITDNGGAGVIAALRKECGKGSLLGDVTSIGGGVMELENSQTIVTSKAEEQANDDSESSDSIPSSVEVDSKHVEGFIWDIGNPFATPTASPVRVVRFEAVSPATPAPIPLPRRFSAPTYCNLAKGGHNRDVEPIDNIGENDTNMKNLRRVRRMRRGLRSKTMQILGNEAIDAIMKAEAEAEVKWEMMR